MGGVTVRDVEVSHFLWFFVGYTSQPVRKPGSQEVSSLERWKEG